jgi:hypothetical protein
MTAPPVQRTADPKYCKCAFTDPDGTFNPGEACPVHPDVIPQRESPVRDCEANGGEHDWEGIDYDPSVGLFGGRECTICGAQAEDDAGEDDDIAW